MKEYHVYDLFNDNYSILDINKIEILLIGGNPLYITDSKQGIEIHLKRLGEKIK